MDIHEIHTVTKICNSLIIGLSILIHGFISLTDATSYGPTCIQGLKY